MFSGTKRVPVSRLLTIQTLTWLSSPGSNNLLRQHDWTYNISAFRTSGETDKHYVSVVSNDDFHAFQQNGYHDDEDIDFSPQNGYYQEEEEEEEPRTVVNSKGK